MRLLTVLCVLSATSAAQDMSSMMPKPAPELKHLTDLIGTWDVDETHEPSPWMPKAAKGKGVAVYTKGPGGLSVIIDYKSTAGPLPTFQGHGLMTWDPNQKVYKSAWTDVMTPNIVTAVGKQEAANYVYESESEMGGKKFRTREVISDITPKSFTSTTTIEGKTIMTLRFRRRS
jgi:hypothetical protein